MQINRYLFKKVIFLILIIFLKVDCAEEDKQSKENKQERIICIFIDPQEYKKELNLIKEYILQQLDPFNKLNFNATDTDNLRIKILPAFTVQKRHLITIKKIFNAEFSAIITANIKENNQEDLFQGFIFDDKENNEENERDLFLILNRNFSQKVHLFVENFINQLYKQKIIDECTKNMLIDFDPHIYLGCFSYQYYKKRGSKRLNAFVDKILTEFAKKHLNNNQLYLKTLKTDLFANTNLELFCWSSSSQ